MPLSLPTLPVEMIYRILDHLDTFAILVSCRNVCKKLNDIIDTYHRYQVILIFHFQTHCSSFFNIFIYIFYSFKYVELLMFHRYRNIPRKKKRSISRHNETCFDRLISFIEIHEQPLWIHYFSSKDLCSMNSIRRSFSRVSECSTI